MSNLSRQENNQPTDKATWRQWTALTVLMLPVLLVSVDNTVLSFAIPEISKEFNTSGTTLLWIIDAYSLILAGLLVPMGSFGDRFGRRLLLMVGGAGFTALSVVAGLSTSAEMLVVARFGLGFFGAMLMPSTMSLIRNIFVDREQRRLAVAIWAAAFSAGSALGPIVGGALLENFFWGSVFFMAVPVLVPMLVLIPIFVPESKDPNPGPIDPISIVLVMFSLTPFVFAIKSFTTEGFTPLAAAAALVGIAAGALFVRRQLSRPVPMLEVRLFAYRPFTGSVVVNLLAVFSLTGFLYFGSQHLQLVLGLPPFEASLWLVPGLIATVAAGLLVVFVVRRYPIHRVMSVSLLITAVGYAIIALTGNGASALVLSIAFGVLGIGIGASETLSNDVIISAVPPQKAGAASAISETAYELGAVLGTAVLGSILVASYRNAIELPADLSGEQQKIAGETLGGAINVAEQLPSTAAEQLLTSAHHAFDAGVVVTAGIGTILMVLGAVLAAKFVVDKPKPLEKTGH